MRKMILTITILSIVLLSGCSNYSKNCEEIAKRDYNMNNPFCLDYLSTFYGSECRCVEVIEKENSFQEDISTTLRFKLKNEAQLKN